MCFDKQRLNAGDDPASAFALSSEAAVAGAESTKHMQAQVNLKSDTQCIWVFVEEPIIHK